VSAKVSVIIPTYKRSDYLRRAVDSVLGQTCPNIEVIVVDDNHPDTDYRTTTERQMLRYRENNNVVYLKNDKNLGGALARNKGIERATESCPL
jgi:glycosyltransferase involved in cell wall biosynthesis